MNIHLILDVGIEHLRGDAVFQAALKAPRSEKIAGFIGTAKKACKVESAPEEALAAEAGHPHDDFQRRKYKLKRNRSQPRKTFYRSKAFSLLSIYLEQQRKAAQAK